MLHRELYRGRLVWGRTIKRDQWGQKHEQVREESAWVRHQDASLCIVNDDLWADAHARVQGTRRAYLRGTGGHLWGRPTNGQDGRYLLSGLAHCGWCGGTLEVRSRSHGRRRKAFYGCASYHRRGSSVCANKLELPLDVADRVLLDAIEHEVLHPETVEAAIREALETLRHPAAPDPEREAAFRHELLDVDAQLGNVTAAVKLGGPLPSLVAELRTLESSAPWTSLAVGFAVLVATPVAAAVLVATLLGAPLGVALAALYVVTLIVGLLVGVTWVGAPVTRLFRHDPSPGRVMLSVLIGLLVVAALQLVPVIGGAILMLLMILGIGGGMVHTYRLYSGQAAPGRAA